MSRAVVVRMGVHLGKDGSGSLVGMRILTKINQL